MAVREAWVAEEEPKGIREAWKVKPTPVEVEPPTPEISPLAQLEYEGLPLDPEARKREELRRVAMGEVAQAPAVFPLPLPIPGMIGGIGPPAPELSLEAIKKGAIAQVGGATTKQVLEESVPEFAEALVEGHLPTAIAQTGEALGKGILGFADRVVSQAGDIVKQFATRGEVDWNAVQALGEARQAIWEYDPSDPAAQLATKFVAAVPYGVKTAFHTLADEFKGSPNIEAGLRTVGDMAELAAFGKVFRTLGAPLRGREAVRQPALKEVKATERAVKRDLRRQEKAEKAARAEEAARVKAEEPPPKVKVREAEISEEPLTIEEALAEREKIVAPKVVKPEVKPDASFLGWQETATGEHIALYNIESGPKRGTTVTLKGLKREGAVIPKTTRKPPSRPAAKAIAKEKETPVADSSEALIDWVEVERLTEEARVARGVEPRVVAPPEKAVAPPKPTITLETLREKPELYKEVLDNRELHTKEVVTRAEEIGARVLAEIELEGDIVSRYKKKESTKSIAKRHKMPEDEVVSILDEAEVLGKVKPLTLEIVKDRYRRELREVANEVAQKGLSPEQARPLVMARHERLADKFSDGTRYKPISDVESMEISAFLNEMLERIEPRKRTAADVDASEAQVREVAKVADEVRGEPDVTLEFGGFEGFGKMYRDFANSLRRRSTETEKPLSPEAREVLDRGEIVKHKTIKGRRRPPVFRAEREIIMSAKKLTENPYWGRALQNPHYTFEEAGGWPLLGLTTNVYNARVFAATLLKKKVRRGRNVAKKKIGGKNFENLKIYHIAVQKRGIDLLKARGISEKEIARAVKEAEASPSVMEAYRWLRERYEMWERALNNVRKAIGKDPFPKEEDYTPFIRTGKIKGKGEGGSVFTFARLLSMLERQDFKPMDMKSDIFARAYARAGSTAFRFAKRRRGGTYKLEMDPFKGLEMYENMAIDHIQMSPLIAKLREYRSEFKLPDGKTFILQNENPVLDKAIGGFANHIAGMRPEAWRFPIAVERMLLRINNNLVASILGFVVRSALIQPAAMLNVYSKVGLRYTAQGIASLLWDTPSSVAEVGGIIFKGEVPMRSRAAKYSKLLTSRVFEAAQTDVIDIVKRSGRGRGWPTRQSLKPLQILDFEFARAAWESFYLYAIEELGYKGGRNSRAAAYADHNMTVTQASGLPGHIAPIQRVVAGRVLTLFQTFNINDWNFLIRHVMGKSNVSVDTPLALAQTLRYIVGATMVNMLYEDVLGVFSPKPTPIRAGRESVERGESLSQTLSAIGTELIEPVPIMGGMFRFEKAFGGPVTDLALETIKFLRAKPGAKPWWELAGKWRGMPGTGQAAKIVRGRKRGETLYGQIVGTYTPPEERARPSRRGRGLRSTRGGLRGGF